MIGRNGENPSGTWKPARSSDNYKEILQKLGEANFPPKMWQHVDPSGTWKPIRFSDNYKEILPKLGVPPKLVEEMASAEAVFECTEEGHSFTIKRTVMGQTVENTYTLGVQSEETDPTGTMRMVTWTLEGEVAIATYPNYDGKGLMVREKRWFLDNKMKTVRKEYKVGDMEGWVEVQMI